jgi:hypothetical protein
LRPILRLNKAELDKWKGKPPQVMFFTCPRRLTFQLASAGLFNAQYRTQVGF